MDSNGIGSNYLSGSLLSESDVSFNCRRKYWRDDFGELHLYEQMVCSRGVFRDSGTEVSDFTKAVNWRLDYNRANAELFGNGASGSSGFKPLAEPDHEESVKSSRRRARRKIFDYIMCNPFDCFVTLTLDGSLIDRDDYKAVIDKLNNYLDNRVRRRGLIYVGVPELHKKGGLHFHFCMNADALKLVDSGAVSVIGKKRPIKRETANRLHIPLEQRHTVYNVTDWKLGFSTAIMTYGDRGAVAHYMTKELFKLQQKGATLGEVKEKIGGRWYLSGGKLHKPVVELSHVCYEGIKGQTFIFDSDYAKYKVFQYSDDGRVLSFDGEFGDI